jgi:hypothetical protein
MVRQYVSNAYQNRELSAYPVQNEAPVVTEAAPAQRK